ncbi:MAG: hypothetical protein IKP62_07925 [Salinivirgaceae bacterium]|nr:hypothetical protein [Salinivirgaceae bacterium]
MRTLLILGLCATAMVANAQTGKDTVIRYAINGQKINNFDGTMLLDKTISNYEIDTLVLPNSPVVLLHNIRTADAGPVPEYKITMRANGNGIPSTIVVIDGKKSTEADMKALNNDKIKSIEVLKGKAAKAYTNDPNVGVVIVTTKKK